MVTGCSCLTSFPFFSAGYFLHNYSLVLFVITEYLVQNLQGVFCS